MEPNNFLLSSRDNNNICQKESSFFESMLPNPELPIRVPINLYINFLGNPKAFPRTNLAIRQLSEFLLKVVLETSEAIIEARYKKFDALIRNFGCQITALNVQEKMRNPHLYEEAVGIKQLAQEKLSIVTKEKLPTGYLAKKDKEKDMLTYLREIQVDFEVSSEMIALARFRLLNIINGIKVKNGQEKSYTDLNPINERVSLIDGKGLGIDKDLRSMIVRGIQIDESAKAVLFIRNTASKLKNEDKRTELIQRMLSPAFQKSKVGILSVPLLYNTEAVIKSIKGIVLVKNKLFLGEVPINGALPMKIFLKMPEERILTEEEIKELCPNEPLIVIEGYINNNCSLKAAIQELGLNAIINSNNAILPQYANCPNDPQIIDDEEAQKDIFDLQKAQWITKNVLELDHIYCASVEEER